jgi:hypothetical protein
MKKEHEDGEEDGKSIEELGILTGFIAIREKEVEGCDLGILKGFVVILFLTQGKNKI